MKRTLSPFILLLALAVGCTKGGSIYDFDRKLDQRIQEDLKKREKLVQGNPLYLNLMSDMEKARQMLLSGHAKEAYIMFDKILADSRYTKYPEYSYAKYYLACALYEMGVDYGSLLYFVDIVRREPVKPQTHEALRRAIKIAQKLKDDQLILFLASEIPPEKVPRSLQEEFRYFIAKELYERQEYDKASQLFSSLSHKNRLYLAAQYLLGTTGVQKKDWPNAISHYQAISNNRSPVEYYENHKIRQLANLALGRIFYEQQNFPLSIVYYKKVERDGEFYPFALYESSWALFKLNKFNEALSVLQTLNSPFYEQVYFLKSYLLRGAIDLELCNYELAVDTLTTLENKFNVLKGQIDRFASQARTPAEYYPLLSSIAKTPDGGERFKYEDLFKLAAANRDFLGVHRYILRLKKERDHLRDVPSARSDLLSKMIAQKESELTIQASFVAGKKLKLTRTLITDFTSLKDIIRYEIVHASRNILQKRVLGLAPPVIPGQDLIRPEFTESLKESLVWWDFNGEYWQDELGYYLVDRKSRCKEPPAEGVKK